MITIPNSQIRETKEEGPCSFRVVHLIIVRPSHHICCLFMNSQTFFKQYWSQKPLSVQSFLHPHKIMQSSPICARIPKILQQRTGQCLRDHPQGKEHSLPLDFFFLSMKMHCAPIMCQTSHETLGKTHEQEMLSLFWLVFLALKPSSCPESHSCNSSWWAITFGPLSILMRTVQLAQVPFRGWGEY